MNEEEQEQERESGPFSKEVEQRLFRISKPAPYTGWIAGVFAGAVLLFTVSDTEGVGFRFISRAIGVGSSFWLWTWLLVTWISAMLLSFRITFINHLNHALWSGTEEAADYGESGGGDITLWAEFAAVGGTLYVFGVLIPEGLFGVMRPFVALFVVVVATVVFSKTVSDFVFKVLYGPPKRRKE